MKILCPFCKGDGKIVARYDPKVWEPICSDGCYGYEFRNKETGEVVQMNRGQTIIDCPNCNAIGVLEFDVR